METSNQNQENLRQGSNQDPNLARDYLNTPFLPSQNTLQQLGAINPTLLEQLQNLKNQKKTPVNTPPKASNRFPNRNPAIFNQPNPLPKIPNQTQKNSKTTFFSAESIKKNPVKIIKILGKTIEETAKIGIQIYKKHQQDKKDDRNGYLLEQKWGELRKTSEEE